MTRAIDLFAGAGGFTEGATNAGVDVVWSANHWQLAVDVHAANHPNTVHSCQDLQQADFTRLPEFDILLASPACQGHSAARGKDRPQHDAMRATAWAIIACVEANMPSRILVENVPAFANWALYPTWKQALETYGYTVREQILNAADFGVPQDRHRMIVSASLDGPLQLTDPGTPHASLGSCLDWDSARWSPIHKPGRAQATVQQIEAAKAKHAARFAIVYNGSRNHGRSLDRPSPTVMTVDSLALVDVEKDAMRMLTVDEYRRVMSFRDDYKLASTKANSVKLLGNAVPPLMAENLVHQAVASL